MPPKVKVKTSASAGASSAPDQQQQLGKEYFDSLSVLEQKVCAIAEDHLKSSFDLSRSSGFLAWKNSRK